MKIVFMGTPDFAVPALKALCDKHDVICVYTQAPKEAGRGQKVMKSPVHIFAEEKGIEVRTPKSLRSEEEQKNFADLKADISVVAAYGLILPKAILEPWPCVNIHGSLLPRWRGAAPIHRAIEAGDDKTGITIMEVVEALDAGKMYLKGEIAIDQNTICGTLHDQMSELGARLIIEYLDNMKDVEGEEQDEALVTYAKKIDKEEAKLDFSETAEVLERKIRAFNPFPGANFEHKSERLKLLKTQVVDKKLDVAEVRQDGKQVFIGTKDKSLEILEIQRAGKKPMNIKELLNGFSF